MAVAFTDLTPEGRRYFEELNKLANLEVQVGFQEGEMHEDKDGKTRASLAEIAAYNELGTSASPARPFMRQSFENHQDTLQAACDQVNNTLASGGTAEEGLQQLGVVCKGLVQKEIVDGGFAPNAESTVKKKGSDTPLIDSGHMRQSVNFVIKPRGS